jgi:acetyl esterase/lipase
MMARRTNMLASQPGKSIYTIYYAFTCLARVFAVSLLYIPRALRPIETWGYKTALTTYAYRLWVHYAGEVKNSATLSLRPGKEGERWAILQPREKDKYTGPMNDSQISPFLIGGTWYPNPFSNTTELKSKIILHFHGGAFVMLDCREQWFGSALRTLSRCFGGAKALCADYRPATVGHFPAQLQDAFTSYYHLVEDLKVAPSRIILSGDSAGGHVVLQMLRYFAESQTQALPCAALLWSPWVNVAQPNIINESINCDVDYLVEPLLRWGEEAFTNGGQVPVSSPYVSPAQAPFYSQIPMWMILGTAECFYEQGLQFFKDMRMKTNRIKLYEIPDAPHDPLVCAPWSGHQKEVEDVIERIWQSIQDLEV